MKKLFLFYLIACSGCLNSTKDNGSILIIANTEKSKDFNEPPLPFPSPYSYYGCFNFIFDTNGTLYFYQHFYDTNTISVRVIDFDSNAPIFIDLNPNQLIVIPEVEVRNFIEQNILKVGTAYKIVRVIGVADTIKSKALIPLMKEITDTANHISYAVRKITLEEDTVLSYKKRQGFYYPGKIKWDSTKIWFDRRQMK